MLIAQDVVISISIGQQAPGGGIVTYDPLQSLFGLCRKISQVDEAEMIETGAFGTDKRYRAGRRDFTVELEKLVAYTGRMFIDSDVTIVGQPLKVESAERSGMSRFFVIEGLVERCEWEASDGQLQFERIRLVGPIDRLG